MGTLDRIIVGCIFVVTSGFAYFGYMDLNVLLSPYAILFLAALGGFYFISGFWFVYKLFSAKKRPAQDLPTHSQANPFRGIRK